VFHTAKARPVADRADRGGRSSRVPTASELAEPERAR
jgi:hypothetical protein